MHDDDKRQNQKPGVVTKVPLIESVLYNETPILLDDAILKYIEALLKTNTPHNIGCAGKLREYLFPFEEMDFSDDIANFLKHIEKYEFKNKFNLEIQMRKKSLIKFVEKLFHYIANQYINMGTDLEARYSLERVSDIYGVRFILDFQQNQDTEEAIQTCYEFLKLAIHFFTAKCGYTLKVAGPMNDTNFNKKDFRNVIVPEISGVDPFYRINVKDYYAHPKENSYQSLHVIFTKGGSTWELQIRTRATDMRISLNPDTSHSAHDKKYSDRISLDYSRIGIIGFDYNPETGVLYDSSGLIHAQTIYSRKIVYIPGKFNP